MKHRIENDAYEETSMNTTSRPSRFAALIFAGEGEMGYPLYGKRLRAGRRNVAGHTSVPPLSGIAPSPQRYFPRMSADTSPKNRIFAQTHLSIMSNYIVSARKYRPTNFNSVVGQSALTTTLKNAISSGKLAHAYLFCGPRGVGKTTSARIFAKTINCLSPNEQGEACDACESCVAFNEQRSYNIHELDAASNNSVDDIRELIEQVQIPPQVGRYKVFIIDEVHMLSPSAFNAFLKTLEEPPAHAIFILATTEKHKILPTILSRCQIYDFNRMEVGDIVGHLKRVAENEGISYEEAALNVIARKADGGMRDALSIFDQVASFTSGNITYAQVIDNLNVLDYDYYFDLTDSLLKIDIPKVMLTLNTILSKGFDGNHFMGGLAAHFRDLLVSRDPQTLPLLEVAESVRQRYAEQAARCTPKFLYAALRLCNDCDINYRASRNKRLLVELTLIQVAQLLQEDEAPASGRRPTRRLLPIFAPNPAQTAATGAPQTMPSATAGLQRSPMPQPQVATSRVSPPSVGTSGERTAPTSFMAHREGCLKTVSLTRREPAPTEVGTTATETTAVPKERSNESFTLEHLAHYLLRYAQLLPREHSPVAERLKGIATDRGRLSFDLDPDTGHPKVKALVDNVSAAQFLQEFAPNITQYLRQALHNDGIQVLFEVTTTENVQRRAFTPRERFTRMLEKSEDLRFLVNALKLELN